MDRHNGLCTKINWARKSQQPLAMAWTIARRKFMSCEGDCTTDKKVIFLHIELLLTSSMRATTSLTNVTVDRK